MVFYRYLGYGTTDSNGEAKLEYDENGNHLDHSITGTGAGELDIVASLDKPISSGSIVSETYEVFDCIKVDNGTSSDHNDFWYVNGGSLNRGNTETEILINNGQTYVMSYFGLSNTDSFVIEFDTIFDCVRGAFGAEVQFRNLQWTPLNGIYLGDYPKDTWTHIKLQVKDGQLRRWVNDTELSSSSISDIYMFDFYRGQDDNYLKFKNFRYYPI